MTTKYSYELYSVKPNAPVARATAISGGELTHNGTVLTLEALAQVAGDRAILLTGYQEPGAPWVKT